MTCQATYNNAEMEALDPAYTARTLLIHEGCQPQVLKVCHGAMGVQGGTGPSAFAGQRAGCALSDGRRPRAPFLGFRAGPDDARGPWIPNHSTRPQGWGGNVAELRPGWHGWVGRTRHVAGPGAVA